MPQEPGLQQLFFQQIRNQIRDQQSFVHEIAGLLRISYDSAYRRIKGDKEMTLDELVILSDHFGLSLDAIFNLVGKNVVFRNFGLQTSANKINDWLSIIYQYYLQASKADDLEVIYAAKDPPIHQYFQFPEIAAFKFFFWRKTLFENTGMEDDLFRLDELSSDDIATGEKLLEAAVKMPTIEIWNEDTFNMFSRQIEYYWESGFFEKKDDLLNIIDKMEKWVRHMQRQADLGFKFRYGQPAVGPENSFMMYENEVVLNDNAIYSRIGNVTTVYLTYNVISLMICQDSAFCREVEQFLKGLMKRSTLISLTGSKGRNRFFNKLFASIEASKRRMGIS
jgi:hypothetical protein